MRVRPVFVMPAVNFGATGKEQIVPLKRQLREVIRILAPKVLDVATMENLAFAIGATQAKKILNLIVGIVIDDLLALKSLKSQTQLLLTRRSRPGEIIPVLLFIVPASKAGWSSYG